MARVTSWRHEAAFRRRIANIGHLLSGNVASAGIAMLAVALTARALGPADYGILALIISYARAVERLVTFNSWQPLIKYGAAFGDDLDHPDFKRLIKFGLMLDIGAALLAWVAAVAVALAGGLLFEWQDTTVELVLLYSTVLLFNITGTPTAILRLLGRFRVAAYGPTIAALGRLACCAAGVAMGAGLRTFTLIWMATTILGAVAFLVLTLLQLRKQGVRGLLRPPLRGVAERFPGLWGFAWSSNLSLTIRTSAQEFDTLMVGAFAGPAAAGLYHIAKRVSRVAQQVGVHVQAVLYPDIARLWAEGAIERMRRAVWQVEAMVAAYGLAALLVLLVVARPLLGWAAGPAFEAAAPLVVAQMFAVTLTMTGAASRSALLAMGRQQQVLTRVLVATAGFHITALLLIPRIGAMGANIAHIVMGLIFAGGMIFALRKALASPRTELGQDNRPADTALLGRSRAEEDFVDS